MPDDHHFAETQDGSPVNYGEARDCMSMIQNCHEGEMRVDLTGTGFTLHPEVVYYSHMWPTYKRKGIS